jgi:predicted nucleotide-binding protein
MSKFLGDFSVLKAKVEELRIAGEWIEDLPNGQKQFSARNGAILNWWDTKKGTLTFQGDEKARTALEASLIPLLETTDDCHFLPSQNNRKKVFVVYGHDVAARTQLDAMLRRWGLEPLILDQLPSKGMTIIEKLEQYTSQVDFAVVLATPDDEGYRKEHEDEKTYRARQNVVLELGMMLTKLGRNKVAILLKDQEKMERPSDIQGLIYIPFKDDIQKDAGQVLAKEMVAQGYSIDVKNL